MKKQIASRISELEKLYTEVAVERRDTTRRIEGVTENSIVINRLQESLKEFLDPMLSELNFAIGELRKLQAASQELAETFSGLYIRDDNGHAWHYADGRIRMVAAELEGTEDNGYLCDSLVDGVRLLNEMGYITGFDEESQTSGKWCYSEDGHLLGIDEQ